MTNGTGFISPETNVEEQLYALTAQVIELPSITRGIYVFNEDDLLDEQRELLHGRAFVIDRKIITETGSGNPRTYYIAADAGQGLIVPARSLSIKTENSDAHYRWTDDGIYWTEWITIPDLMLHTYDTDEKCRFAEVQVYVDVPDALVSVRATR